MAFHSVSIPLLQGQNAGTADLSAVSQSQQLLAASNVVFTRIGSVRGRPGTVSQDAAVLMFDGNSTGGSSLSTAFGFYQPAALHTLNSQVTGGQTSGSVFQQCHGRLFKRNPSEWTDVGPCWSVKRQTWGSPRTVAGDATQSWAVDVGPALVAIPTYRGLGANTNDHGFTAYNPDGTVRGQWNPYSITDFPEYNSTILRNAVCVANTATFWAGQAPVLGHIFMQQQGAFPVATEFTLSSSGATDTYNATNGDNSQRIWAAWDGTNYYVAFMTGAAGSNSVSVGKFTTGGALVGSLLNYVGTTPITSVCLAVDSGSGLGLLLVTTGGGGTSGAISRVITLSSMTDAGHTITHTVSGGTGANTTGGVCGIANGVGYVAWHGNANFTNNYTADIYTRTMTSTTATLVGTYTGDRTGGTCGFRTLFPPLALAGRVVMGLLAWSDSGQTGIGPKTWAVVDITQTPLGTAGHQLVSVVAAGETGGCSNAYRASSAYVAGGSLYFGVVEGVTYGESTATQFGGEPGTGFLDIETGKMVTIQLTPQGAPSCQVDNQLLIGGNVSYLFDGAWCTEAGWIEVPVVTATTGGTGTALPPSTSYSLQTVWTYTDSTGRVTRSNASNLFTLTTAFAGNTALNVTASVPQLATKPSTNTARIELYMSVGNPAAGAPLYLIQTAGIGLTPGTATASFLVNAAPVTTAKEIYTLGNVLNDDRVPSDRGVAVVDNRVWTADEHFLYPSHNVSDTIAPAWDLEVYPIEVPAAFGRILGLGAIDDKAVAICEGGVVMVNGPGFDDTGSGAGWSVPSRVYTVGGTPVSRSTVNVPAGVVFVGQDGLLYIMDRTMSGSCISQASRLTNNVAGELTYVPPVANLGQDTASNPLVVQIGLADALNVLDLSSGQWCQWVVAGVTPTSIMGTPLGLCASLAASPYVVQFSGGAGTDHVGAFGMSVRIAPQETTKDGLLLGWGRVRSVSPVFIPSASHTLSVVVAADEGQRIIMNKSANITE